MATSKPARISFAKQLVDVPIPDLIEVQINSYKWLFEEGIKELLYEISPIEDFTGKLYSLEFGKYYLDTPKHDEETARTKNLTYKAPLKCQVMLHNKETGRKKEAEVFLGEFPLMTERGTFIINGVERVVVSQIVRSYGVLFVTTESANERKLFGAKVIPHRGAWLEFETSSKDILTVKVDRERRIPVTTFLRALGMVTDKQMIDTFSDVDDDIDHPYIKNTLAKDTTKTQEDALVEVYKRIRPGDLVTPETAKIFLENLFFNFKRYDLGKVGRYKINRRLDINLSDAQKNRVLRVDDVIAVIKELIRLNNDPMAKADDIDSLKNRRIRAIGELVQGRFRVGLLRVERIIKDRMSVIESENITPSQLINSRPITAVLQEFFASSQMSQFMNQTNPLSELEHKRTLSATGPGGLSRERAGFEVRDVHESHYGRICPIETPEGPNIGLVGYLASYARINEYGFIESPYLVVDNSSGKPRVTKKVVYLDAMTEETSVIAPASTSIDKDGYFTEAQAVVRKGGEPSVEKTSEIQYMDVSAKQIVSITTSCIPFVEHDDATRASMGSNMERQAVPLVKPQSPVVGTGVEADAVRASGQVLTASVNGTVVRVDASEIVVKPSGAGSKEVVHKLAKFERSNQGTCINQRPAVTAGDTVKKGDLLADSYGSQEGELALGQNITVAFMPFDGLNYEDAIILSQRLLRDDRYTSVHIEKYSIEIRDTKLGPEVVTRDIPNVGEDALAHLDEQGVVRIGAEVSAGDILVGKITPKGETELTAEEKLLRAIFGEKAKDVKDTSLRLPHGERGKVVEVKIFNRDAGDELAEGVYQMIEISVAQLRKVAVGDKLAARHGNKGVISSIVPEEDMPYLPDGTPVDMILNPLGVVSRMNLGQIMETHLGAAASKLGYKVASKVFEGIALEKVMEELKKAGLAQDGKTELYDGRTGEKFSNRVTVGTIYIMKLLHLVDDKMHARSIGPYSMVTQQPLGGKAQFGGQRFGEMEVWALEAYGASHTLQEMLTIKSDDVAGRSRAYESIIKNEPIQKPSIPASFMVLVRELQSLGLNVEMLGTKQNDKNEPNNTEPSPLPDRPLPNSDNKEKE
ncbi:DNA-directed RNA polymerase subunit beta [Patescibacteria group bacterium]|nr:DNA-directed RNA polymerase subunit beta [Patescibacteria group bacterium]